MNPIKKFSTEMNQPKSILETIDSKALTELINGLGFKNIHELKREKNLLSKLEALLKEVNPGETISEDDAKDIEDKLNKKAEPKSLEDKTGEKESETPVGSVGEVAEEAAEEAAEEETTEEETAEETEASENAETQENETEEIEDETEEIETEEVETPKATRRIMTFEDFIKEETINKNVSYRDDEDEEDYAVPVADSKEEEFEEEEELEETSIVSNKTVKTFNQFVSEALADLGPELKDEEIDYEGAIVVPVAKGDGVKTADEIEDEEVEAGKPKVRDEKEGEVLVTVDQEIVEEPETSDDEPETFGTVVVGESVNEAEVKSDEDFKEYAFTVLQNAFGNEFDETKAQELVDGLTSKYSGDYGAMIGALKSSLNK